MDAVLRGLYAITPDETDTRHLTAKVGRRARRRSHGAAIPKKTADPSLRPRAG